MAQYPNLPGIDVSIADGGFILPEDATTESLLIIAPSVKKDAPKEPVLVRQSSELTANGFGTFVEGGIVNPIAAAWKAAFEGGNRRTYLMSLGTYDEVTGEVENVDAMAMTDEEKFTFLQNALFGVLADFSVNHIVLLGVTADKEAELTAEPLLANGVVNEFSKEGTVALTIVAGTDDTIVINGTELTLAAKTYTEAELQTELAKELHNAGIIDVTATVADGKVRLVSELDFTVGEGSAFGLAGQASKKSTGNFALLAGQYAESQTFNHTSTIAYIGVGAPHGNTLAQIKANVDRLVNSKNEYSGYVQVVAAPELGYVLPGKNDLYFANGVVTYAALVSTLAAESAPTNKKVSGVSGIHYNLSLRQLNDLTGAKYVTFRLKNGQVVVTDGVTTAPDYLVGGTKQSSDYTRLSTLRITQTAAQLVRNATEKFIGEPNRAPQYNSMNATIKASLEAMKNAGALTDYRFTVVSRGRMLDEAVVTLELIPAFEMKKITVNVSLKPSYTF